MRTIVVRFIVVTLEIENHVPEKHPTSMTLISIALGLALDARRLAPPATSPLPVGGRLELPWADDRHQSGFFCTGQSRISSAIRKASFTLSIWQPAAFARIAHSSTRHGRQQLDHKRQRRARAWPLQQHAGQTLLASRSRLWSPAMYRWIPGATERTPRVILLFCASVYVGLIVAAIAIAVARCC